MSWFVSVAYILMLWDDSVIYVFMLVKTFFFIIEGDEKKMIQL